MRVAVLGASGFIGASTVTRLRDHGLDVTEVSAPRLQAAADLDAGDTTLVRELAQRHSEDLKALVGADVVVNAAGLPDAGSRGSPALFGANALLPGLLAQAAAERGVRRMVHISSAAVHGPAPVLDETAATSPFSPYSRSKALGESFAVACAQDRLELAILRPTSVHSSERSLTRGLARLAGSHFSAVAGDGSRPTPQVLLQNVAAAVVLLVEHPLVPPTPVLQPWEGVTTSGLLRLLGLGREPRRLPDFLAQSLVAGARGAGRVSSVFLAHARRLEMLLFGQPQRRGWLDHLCPPCEGLIDDWRRMAHEIRFS